MTRLLARHGPSMLIPALLALLSADLLLQSSFERMPSVAARGHRRRQRGSGNLPSRRSEVGTLAGKAHSRSGDC
jgi:hypothetical protein